MAEVRPVNGEVRLSSDNLTELLKPLASIEAVLTADRDALRCVPGVAGATSIQFQDLKLPIDAELPSAAGPTPNAFILAERPASVVPQLGPFAFPSAMLAQFPNARRISDAGLGSLRIGSGLQLLNPRIPAIDLTSARRQLGVPGSNLLACSGSGQPRLNVSLCVDQEWPAADRPAMTSPLSTSCGPVGWSTTNTGAPTLRIPWRVRLSNLALNAFLTCNDRTTPPAGSVSAALCPILRGTCFGNSRIFATLAGNAPGQPIEVVFETNLTPTRCSRDGAGGAPRCPEFVRSARATSDTINLPGIALVPSFAVSSIRTINADGSLGPERSFVQLRAQSFEPGIGCRDLAEPLLNALATIAVPILEPVLLRTLAGPLTEALLGTDDAPGIVGRAFPAPRVGSPPSISPPNCQVIAPEIINLGSQPQCLQDWITYALQRTAYRYITGPFNGPEGNNPVSPSWLWRNWRIDTSGSPNRRRDLIVAVEPGPANPMILACAPGAPTNPQLSTTTDGDGDGIPDACDNCPAVANRSQHNCNRETEQNLGRNVPGISLLGDACDPNPCAALRPTAVGTTSRLDGTRAGTSWFGRITTHPTVGSNDSGPAADDARLTEVTALRRCGCGSIDAMGVWRPDSSAAQCASERCSRDGTVGRANSGDGFQLTDYRLRQTPCTRRPSDGRCDVRENETYVPEVTLRSVADGRAGRERDNTSSYEWDYKGEYLRGALFEGNQLFTEEQNLARFIPSAAMFLWTRADRREGTTTPERLRDHYSPLSEPLSVRLGTPIGFGFERLGINPCLLVPRLCSPIPVGRLRGIANFVAPRPPFGQPKVHRFVTSVALSQSQLAQHPWLDGDRGDLAPSVAALAVGVYDAEAAQFTALGPSVGDVPPFEGTAFAFGTGADGEPTVFAMGGRNSLGISPFVYEGKIELSENGALTRWTKRPLPTSGDVAIAGPLPRADAAVTASLDGRSIYLYGGSTTYGALHDAWRYNLADHSWEQIELPVRPAGAARAAIAVDGDWLVIAGGLDDNGAPSAQWTAVQQGTGHSAQRELSTGAVVDARLALDRGRLWLYGGTAAQAASDQLVEVSLETGMVLRSVSTGVASAAGAGLGVDPDGTLSILPFGQPSASARDVALVGSADRLVALDERTESGASTCSAATNARIGLPCQIPSSTSTVGALVCSDAAARCVGSAATTLIDTLDGSAYALDQDFIAVANRETIRVVHRSAPSVVVAEVADRRPVRSVALSSSWLFSTSGRSIQWRSLRSSALAIEGELSSCGELHALRVVGDTLYADSSFGVERFRIEPTGLRRWPDHVFASALAGEPGAQPVHSLDERGLSLCSAISTFFRVPLERLRERRAFDVTDDGTLWIAQGARLFALQQRADGRLSIAATRRLSSETNAVRAVGRQLAVLGADRATQRETFALVPAANGRHTIESRGAHELDQWIVRRPEQAESTLVQRAGERIEIHDVH